MDGLAEQIGAIIGGFLDQPIVRLIVAAMAAYVVLLWLASAFWALNDMRRRTPDPVLPFVSAGGIVVASPLLFPLALIVYAVLRPRETLAEARERELSEQIEQIEAEDDLSCPECATRVEEDWLACPSCRTRLAHRCATCERSMGLDWVLCAWCGAEFGRPVVPDRVVPVRRSSQPRAGEPRAEPAAMRVLDPGA